MSNAYIFDLDGVVTDTAELHFQAWLRLSENHGMPFDESVNDRLKGISRADSLRIILAGREVSDESFEAMLVEKNQYYLDLLDHLTPKDILPGMEQLLDALTARGAKLATASASKNAQSILDRLSLRESFHAISDGYSVERSKPAPDVFIHAAGQLGTQCKNCVVFEDSTAGILGAAEAGMRTVGIGEHVASAAPTLLYKATEEISLEEILQIK